MREERVGQPLERVYATFEKGRVQPLSLEWAGRRYNVRRTVSRWIEGSSTALRHGFGVNILLAMTSGDVFHVTYDGSDSAWRLEAILEE